MKKIKVLGTEYEIREGSEFIRIYTTSIYQSIHFEDLKKLEIMGYNIICVSYEKEKLYILCNQKV